MDLQQRETLYQKAEELPQIALTMAAASFAPFLEKYPVLKELSQKEWNAVLFTANVYGALLRLMPMRELTPEITGGLINEVERNAKPIFPEFLEAYQSLSAFVQEHFFSKGPGQNEASRLVQTIGTWVFGSLLNRGPEQDKDHHLSLHLGNAVLLPLQHYWKN